MNQAYEFEKPNFSQWIILISASLSFFVVTCNTTALINALPVIQKQYSIAASHLQWLLNSYILAAASLIAVAGKLSDIFDKKKVFLFGLALYILGSLIVIGSFNFITLVIGRSVQGIAAAFITSITLTVLKVTFKGKYQHSAISVWTASIGLGTCIGPFVGGILTEYLSWQYIFWASAFLMFISAIMAALSLKSNSNNFQYSKLKLNILNVFLLIIGLLIFIFGLVEGNILGWSNFIVLICLLFGILLLFLFYKRELASDNPLLHFEFFRNKLFILANIGQLIIIASAIMAIPFFLNIILQNPSVFGLNPFTAGIFILPFSISVFVFSLLSTTIIAKIGYYRTITGCLLFTALGFCFISISCYLGSTCFVIVSLLIIGTGSGTIMPCFSHLGLSQIDDSKTGLASGLLNTITYFGDLAGIAVYSIVYFLVGHFFINLSMAKYCNISYSIATINKLLMGNAETKEILLREVPSNLTGILSDVIYNATCASFAGVMLLCAVLCIITAFIYAKHLNKKHSIYKTN